MTIGLIDIGSNSVRMAWLEGDAPLPKERLRYSRFAEHATATGVLSKGAVDRTIEAIFSLLEEAEVNGVTICRISATSALREAKNRDEIKAYMEQRLGREITVLAGTEEAQFSYEGAVQGVSVPGTVPAVLDVGGGSTELCWGTKNGESVSVPVGAVRLKESAAQIGPLTNALAPLSIEAPKGRALTLIGVGGTLTTMAAIFENMLSYEPEKIHRKCYAREAIEALNARLKTMSLEERMALPGVSKGRADILSEGLDIAITVMQALDAEQLIVSTTDLLYGQLMRLNHV